ncbi:MAG: hypothetical protein AB2785_13945 [Candidatus Thiodiazotropha endolucinida]
MRRWILFAAIAGLVWWLLSEDPIRYGPGVIAAKPPIQIAVDDMQVFNHRGYSIKPMARFEMSARVLGREDYSFDREAELAPIDLAVGWGPMSDEHVLDRIEISQGGRWYRWHAREMPLQRREIQHNSANMHMIPKDEVIADLLDEVRLGHIVHLRGYLVEARAPDGWYWRSSLSRKDTGARACELIFVESLSIEGPS